MVPGVAGKSRKFFDGLDKLIKSQGGGGVAWVAFPEEGGLKGSIAKKLSDAEIDAIKGLDDWAPGCAVLVVVDKKLENAQSRTGLLRIELGKQLDLAEKKVFKFCDR